MNKSQTTVNQHLLAILAEERCGITQFLVQAGISKSRFQHLLNNTAEARQSEMLRAAAVLKLSESEFLRCFFNQ